MTPKEFALHAHASTNHMYDIYLPYEFHLRMVVQNAEKFIHLIEADRSDIISACWLHDTIEDCRVNFGQIQRITNVHVAEMVRACTNDARGRNRYERMSEACYSDLRTIHGATFVKLCDRIANVQYSKMTGSNMFDMYSQEHKHFTDMLRHNTPAGDTLEPMWQYLDSLFTD